MWVNTARRIRWSPAVLALLAIAGVSKAPALLAQEAEFAAQSVQAGARLFRTKGCLDCHSRGGGLGPDLRAVEGDRTVFGLAASLWNHLPQMQAVMQAEGARAPRLTSWEAGNLMAFLFWLDYFDEPGDSARGAGLCQEKQCVACHQVRGVGGVIGPDLSVEASGSPIMLAAAMWNHLPAMTRAQAERRVGWVAITGAELHDVMAYVEGDQASLVREPLVVMPGEHGRGRQVFEDKRCLACHSVRGVGGTVGPDLGSDVRYETVMDFAAALWNKGPVMLRLMRQRGADPVMVAPQEMADLVAFFYAGRYFGDAGSSSQGAALVRSDRCASCHGPGRGAGEIRGATALGSPTGVVAAVWNHIMADSTAGWDGEWPQVTPGDLANLSAYLQSVGGSR
jgi:mono/diheme cytochrome c family protein